MSIFSKVKKCLLAGALTVACLGFASVAFADAKAISLGDLHGGYVRAENYAFAHYSAWLKGSEDLENSWGEFVVAQENGMDGSTTYTRYIGELTKGQSGSSYYFHVSHKVERKYSSSGSLEYLTRDNGFNKLYRVLYRTPENFVLKRDDGKVITGDFAGEYNLETQESNMSQDAAIYLLEMKAGQSPDIVLQPWRHKYRYESRVLKPGDNVYDLYKRVMNEQGRSNFYGGVLIDAYDESGHFMGTYMVSENGKDIIYSEAGSHKIAWSTEAVG